MTLEQKIRNYMKQNYKNFIDPLTGLVNMTALAEDTAWYMDGDNDEWLDDSNHIVYEIASEFYEINVD